MLGLLANVTNTTSAFFSIDSEEEGLEKGEVLGVSGHIEASPELILSQMSV